MKMNSDAIGDSSTPGTGIAFFRVTLFFVWFLSQYAPVAPEAWRFITNADGKPFVAGPRGQRAPLFNLSHSGSVALLALSMAPCEIGVDIRASGESRRFHALAQRNFAPSEALTLAGLRGSSLGATILRSVVLEGEFLVKARGLGLRLPLDGFWFDQDAGCGRLLFDVAPVCETCPSNT